MYAASSPGASTPHRASRRCHLDPLPPQGRRRLGPRCRVRFHSRAVRLTDRSQRLRRGSRSLFHTPKFLSPSHRPPEGSTGRHALPLCEEAVHRSEIGQVGPPHGRRVPAPRHGRAAPAAQEQSAPRSGTSATPDRYGPPASQPAITSAPTASRAPYPLRPGRLIHNSSAVLNGRSRRGHDAFTSGARPG